MASKRIEHLVAVIRAVAREKRRARSWTPISELRLGAVSEVAAAAGVTPQTVADKFIRQLRPEIKSTAEFDVALESWLAGRSNRLRDALIRHMVNPQLQEDVTLLVGLMKEVEGRSEDLGDR